jgi:hypothetical protein
MFKKQRVSFKSRDIFENKFSTNIDNCFCVVSKMLFARIVNIDGSIDLDKIAALGKHELWSYIFYLYHFNKDSVQEFTEMRNPKDGKANAVLFYDSVMKVHGGGSFSKDALVYFINKMVHTRELRNPIVEYVQDILNREVIPALGSLTVKANSGLLKVVTDPKEAEESNVKVRFRMT